MNLDSLPPYLPCLIKINLRLIVGINIKDKTIKCFIKTVFSWHLGISRDFINKTQNVLTMW